MWKCKLCEINNDDINKSCVICGTGAADSQEYWEMKSAENARKAAAPGKDISKPPVIDPGKTAPKPPPAVISTVKPATAVRDISDIESDISSHKNRKEKKKRGVVTYILIAILLLVVFASIVMNIVSNNNETGNNSRSSAQAYAEPYNSAYIKSVSSGDGYIIDFSDNYAENNFLPAEDVKICFA